MLVIRRFVVSGALLSFLLIAVGCGGAPEGPPRASVSGKITLDGQPVEGGTIYFVPEKGPMASATIAGGSYSISAGERGPVLGKSTVKVEWYRDSGKKDSGGAAISEQAIPVKYLGMTALSVEILAGLNTHDFTLTK